MLGADGGAVHNGLSVKECAFEWAVGVVSAASGCRRIAPRCRLAFACIRYAQAVCATNVPASVVGGKTDFTNYSSASGKCSAVCEDPAGFRMAADQPFCVQARVFAACCEYPCWTLRDF